jgi:hypothetical protein
MKQIMRKIILFMLLFSGLSLVSLPVFNGQGSAYADNDKDKKEKVKKNSVVEPGYVLLAIAPSAGWLSIRLPEAA